MENEIWKTVAGYEGLYEVSDQSRVRSLQSGRWHNRQKILTPICTGCGYLYVNLHKDGRFKKILVHRIVAKAFIPNPNNLATVNHKDEVKTNNAINNLEWMSQKDNVAYSQPQWAARPVQMLDKSSGELLETFPSTLEAQRATGIACSSICHCCRGRLKSAGGFVWRYATK